MLQKFEQQQMSEFSNPYERLIPKGHNYATTDEQLGRLQLCDGRATRKIRPTFLKIEKLVVFFRHMSIATEIAVLFQQPRILG